MFMYLMFYMKYFVMFFMFFSGLLVFCSMRKHILLTLLGMEYLVLCVFIFMVFFVMNFVGDIYLVLVFLTFSVCEAVLGLSVLVTLIRNFGNDHVNSLFMIKW